MSFQHGLSGINAATKQLNAIGNNVSNANTVGFKGSRAEFADMFAANFYGVAATQTGIGVATSTVAQQFGQGNISTTGNQLDLAISGNGFFVMQNANGYSYTRNGQFQIDREGYINNSGDKLMGWAVDANNQIKNGTLTELKVDNSLLAPRASDYNGEAVTLGLNLDSRSAIIDPAVTPFNPNDPKTYTHTTAMIAYDSLGNPIQISTYYVKTAAGQWDVYATAKPTNGATTFDVATGVAVATPMTKLGQLTFDDKGVLKTNAAQTPAALPVTTLPLDPAPALDVMLGGAKLDLKFDFTGSTQFGTNFAVNELTQPGYASSVITNLLIDKTGVMSAKYSNGQTKVIGQVVLANFANLQGLQSIGNNRLIESYASGTPTLNDPGSTNVGLIQSQALEDSNVDMTTELVNMISAQRFYQANAQTIKVEDQIMQSLISLR